MLREDSALMGSFASITSPLLVCLLSSISVFRRLDHLPRSIPFCHGNVEYLTTAVHE